MHLFNELPTVDSVLAIHTDQSRKDASFFNHTVLGLKDLDDMLFMLLLFCVGRESSQYSPELKAFVQFSPHDLARFALT